MDFLGLPSLEGTDLKEVWANANFVMELPLNASLVVVISWKLTCRRQVTSGSLQTWLRNFKFDIIFIFFLNNALLVNFLFLVFYLGLGVVAFKNFLPSLGLLILGCLFFRFPQLSPFPKLLFFCLTNLSLPSLLNFKA